MFKFAPKNEVLWPVEIRAPRGDGSGGVQVFKIRVLFRLLSRTDARTLEVCGRKAYSGTVEEEDAARAEAERLLRAHIVGWEDVHDEQDAPLPFSDEALTAMLNVPYIERAIVSALLQASLGAPAKN